MRRGPVLPAPPTMAHPRHLGLRRWTIRADFLGGTGNVHNGPRATS
ncbi:hypothetical protein [Lentzea sp. NPDC059081]